MRMLGIFSSKKKAAEQSISIGEFAHQHKDLIVIVADPKDDTIFVAYNDRFSSGRLKTSAGSNAHIVAGLMKSANLFDSNIDRFLMGLVDVLKIRHMSFAVNNFIQYLDGALYNISKSHRGKVAADVPENGAIKSPLSVADVVDPAKNGELNQ